MMPENGVKRHLPERMTKDELYEEIIEIADLPEKANTGSYSFRREHLVELLRHLRTSDYDE